MELVHALIMSVDSQPNDNTTNEHSSSTAFVDLSESELDELLDRIEQAKTHGLALSAGDYELLTGAVMMLANMQERLESNDLSVHKLRKHMALTLFDKDESDDEDRWVTLGLTGGQHYLVVVHTFRDEHDNTVTIRLISARHATKHEIAQYQG